jgi:hypothetical protein
MKAYGGVDVWIHIVLTSALVGGEWSASLPCRFTPGIHSIGGWVDHRASLDDVEKRKFLTLPGLELRPLGRPARSPSLYRLSYPGSSFTHLIYSEFSSVQFTNLHLISLTPTSTPSYLLPLRISNLST